MGRHAAVGQVQRRTDPLVGQGRQHFAQAVRAEHFRVDAAVAVHLQGTLQQLRGGFTLADHGVAAPGEHHVLPQAPGQPQPQAVGVGEKARPLRGAESAANQRAVAPGSTALPVAGIQHQDVPDLELGKVERQRQALNAAADNYHRSLAR
jgi:hypothetical protein